MEVSAFSDCLLFSLFLFRFIITVIVAACIVGVGVIVFLASKTDELKCRIEGTVSDAASSDAVQSCQTLVQQGSYGSNQICK